MATAVFRIINRIETYRLIFHNNLMTVQEIDTLSVAEKIQLVEELWDSVAISNAKIPVLAWQKQELDRRNQNFLSNPNSGMSWKEVKKSVT